MKEIILMFFLVSMVSFAQTDTSGRMLSRDVQDCIQKIYGNPDAIKQLMTTLMKDKETMRRIHRELMNDPDMKRMMQEMRSEMDKGMGDDHMHRNMRDDNNRMDMKEQPEQDTTLRR